MNPKLLLALTVLACSSAHAQSVQDDVAALDKKRTAEVARATETINRTYLTEYEKLLQRANLTNDAQGANLVRTMIRRLNPEPESSPTATTTTASTDPVAILTANKWVDDTTAENGHRRLWPEQFMPDGQMTGTIPHSSGTWKIVNNELVLAHSSYPDLIEHYPLPVRLDKWRGTESSGVVHTLSVERTTGGGTPAPAGSPPGKSTGAPDYYGRPNP